mmetsp:Transcript_33580/g.79696  ORF Transcript_33580/g.79696 Transcript_33580/m.79696 type:complete len:202 (-) Transcript_33580:2463-3068(-)
MKPVKIVLCAATRTCSEIWSTSAIEVHEFSGCWLLCALTRPNDNTFGYTILYVGIPNTRRKILLARATGELRLYISKEEQYFLSTSFDKRQQHIIDASPGALSRKTIHTSILNLSDSPAMLFIFFFIPSSKLCISCKPKDCEGLCGRKLDCMSTSKYTPQMFFPYPFYYIFYRHRQLSLLLESRMLTGDTLTPARAHDLVP